MYLCFADTKLAHLTTKLFTAQVYGDQGLTLRLLTHKSVMEGVRAAFCQFVHNKENQIQELSTPTIQPPEGSTLSQVTNHMTRQNSDVLAPAITEAFCLYSRGA